MIPLTGGLWPPPHPLPSPPLLSPPLPPAPPPSYPPLPPSPAEMCDARAPQPRLLIPPTWVFTDHPEPTSRGPLGHQNPPAPGLPQVPTTSHQPAGPGAQGWGETQGMEPVQRGPCPLQSALGPALENGVWSVTEVQSEQSKQMELGLSTGMGKPRREVQYAEKAGAGGDQPRLSGANIPSGMANCLPSADTGRLKM